MRPFPLFVMLFLGAMLILPKDEPQADQTKTPTLAPCQCTTGGICTCDDCECEPAPLVSVVKPAVRTVTPAKNNLGYGTLPTAAPVPDELLPVSNTKPSLTATEAATAQKLYAKNHGPLLNGAKAAVRAPVKAAAAVVRAPIRMVRVFAGTVCSGGTCSPSYRWVERVEHPEYGGYYERVNGRWVWYRNQPQYAEPSYQPRRGLFGRR